MEKKEYVVLVSEVLVREVKVKAKDRSDAISKVEDMYKSEEIVLDSNDFANCDFYCK